MEEPKDQCTSVSSDAVAPIDKFEGEGGFLRVLPHQAEEVGRFELEGLKPGETESVQTLTTLPELQETESNSLVPKDVAFTMGLLRAYRRIKEKAMVIFYFHSLCVYSSVKFSF